MNFKNKMTEIRQRHLAGVTRFISASVLALLFFLVILGRVLYAVLFDKEAELFSQSVEQVLIAVMTTLFFSVVWRIVGERRGQVGFLYEIVNVPVLGGFYFLWKSMPMNMYYTMYVAGVLLALFCFTVYLLWTEETKDIFSVLFVSFWKTAGQIFLIGVLGSICLFAIDCLLIEVFYGWWYVWLAFCYVLAIHLFLSYIPHFGEYVETKSLHFLLERIFLPAYLVMLVILYLYMAKIIVTVTMPVGTMNWYASVAVALYALFYFCLYEEGNSRIRRFLRYGGIALLPVMAMQAWGIYIRFDAYGLTTARYVSMVCNVFGLAVILSGIGRCSGKYLFLLAGLLTIMMTLLPTNMIDVPAANQWNRLSACLERHGMIKDGKVIMSHELTVNEKNDIRSAYLYLAHNPGRWKYPLVDVMKKDNDLRSFLNVYQKENWIDLMYDWEAIDVSGYEKMYMFNGGSDDIAPDGTFTFDTEDGKKTVPLMPYMERLRKGASSGVDGTKAEMTYDVNEYRRIYFNDVRFPKEGACKDARFSGFLLEK